MKAPVQAQAVDPNQVVSAIALNDSIREDWAPAPGVVGFRRPGSTGAIAVNFAVSGTAKINRDFSATSTATLTIPDGETEAWVSFAPLGVKLPRPLETIIVTLQPGSGYTLTSNVRQKAVTLSLYNGSTKPGPQEAARFLIQAAFGPDSDSMADADTIPQNVQMVMAQGFQGWINDQMLRPVGLQKPLVDYSVKYNKSLPKTASWWNRVMGVPSLYPGGKTQIADPLRQRMGFALSELFVVSDTVDGLGSQDQGMASYYDMLLNGSFGNFRDVLFNVAMHPCMGIYLSHLGNVKADPVAGTFPDENFAREIIQLFSVGLWELNDDGTRKLDTKNNPIPTYTIHDITEFARVFTGLNFGNPLDKNGENYVNPMSMNDATHDLDEKTLFNPLTYGVVIPARPQTGTSGMMDINDTINCLFNHPSCPPFICKQLIQRFVTSNPSPAYIGRVTAFFKNNGHGVRGDLKAVLKAILLDTEARDPAMLSSTTFGKVREPLLRIVNLARAFNSQSANGIYDMESATYDYLAQQAYSAPSVFNFFKPGYSPPGPIADAGLVAPELQIINSQSALAAANFHYNSITYGFNQDFFSAPSSKLIFMQVAPELALADNVPALMRRLDLVLTGGTLSPQQHQIIREALEYITPGVSSAYKQERVNMAIYLISTAPEFSVLR